MQMDGGYIFRLGLGREGEKNCQNMEVDQALSVWMGKVVERIRTELVCMSLASVTEFHVNVGSTVINAAHSLGSPCFLPLLGVPEATLYGQTSSKPMALTDLGFFSCAAQ